MGAGIAANPHCPSYRRRRVAWRLPLGGSGRGRSEPRAVPRSAPSAPKRGGSLSGSRTRPSGLASIPSVDRWARVRIRSPAVPAGGRSPRAGSVRLRCWGEPLRLRHRLRIEANLDLPPFGHGSKQAPIFGLSASDRSKLRSSAASIEEANLRLYPLRFPLGASPSGSAGSFRSKQAPILRHRLQRAETRFRLPVLPRGEPRFRSGRALFRSKLRLPALPPSLPRGDSRFGSDGCSSLAEASGAAGRLSKSGRASAFAYAGPASSTVPPPAFRPFLLRGRSFPLLAASGRDRFRFRGRIPSVHAMKTVMESESRQADSACG